MWSFKKKKIYYENLLKEVETFLIKNDVTPVYHFKDKGIRQYLIYYPFMQIYCLFARKDINKYINKQERDFATFIRRLEKIKKKPVNLLLDTPADYEYTYPSCIGWKDNPKYEEEVNNYRNKLEEYEKQKKTAEQKRNKLRKKPEARIYLYVKDEDARSRCPACAGTGIIPTIHKKWGYRCRDCLGTGKTKYLPAVKPEQRLLANKFEAELKNLQIPEFSAFPRKKKLIYIRVVQGGQIFIIEK